MNGNLVKMLALAAICSAPIFANQVQVTIGSGFTPNGPWAPYVATVAGLSTTVVCDDATDTISDPETWAANVFTLNSVINQPSTLAQTQFGFLNNAATLYEQVAYLTMQFSANPVADWSGIQTEIWHIFDPSASENVSGLSTDPKSTAYWANVVAHLTPAQYTLVTAASNNIEILTPSPRTGPFGGGPQEFVVITPEPSTYALFGSGVILLSLATFRRRRDRAS